MEKQGAHNSHATAAENGANHGFLGVRQSVDSLQQSIIVSDVCEPEPQPQGLSGLQNPKSVLVLLESLH